jgi:hypothetical protein
MRRFLLPALVAGLAAALLSNCAGPRPAWRIVKQVNPAPFAGERRFKLSIDFPEMRFNGKTEPQYAETGSGGEPGWVRARDGFSEAFIVGFTKATDVEVAQTGALYVVKVSVGNMDPGAYVGMSQSESTTPIVVQVTTPSGAVLDEVVMRHHTVGGTPTPSPDPRMSIDAVELGELVSSYLVGRRTQSGR